MMLGRILRTKLLTKIADLHQLMLFAAKSWVIWQIFVSKIPHNILIKRSLYIFGQPLHTSRASLCALGIYLHQHQLLDDLKMLPVPQKKDRSFSLGENA